MKLTDSQKHAAEYTNSPLLIVAGPGSGKTRVLTQKGVFLIEEMDFDPKSILMTTFTIKASEEIRQRIEDGTSKDISTMFIGTVHSFCENIIKQYGGGDTYPEFQVLDDFKRYLFVKRNLRNLGIDLDELKKLKRVQKDNELIVMLTSFYDMITENLIDVDSLKSNILDQDDNTIVKNIIDYNLKKDVEINVDQVKILIESVIDSYKKYVALMEAYKFLDFCHLESIAWNVIDSDDEVLAALQNKFQYVLIDEFQDINPLQWKILSRIAEKHHRIACVGDKNQSIYGFRGANPNIFDYFEKEYPNSKRIDLGDNFRSKKDIVDVSSLFLKRRARESINLNPMRSDDSSIFYVEGETEKEASRGVLNFIKDLKEKRIIDSYGDVAVLFRSLKYHGSDFIKLLNMDFKDISYSLYGGISFLGNDEIRVLCFLLGYVFSLDDRSVVKQLTDFDTLFDVFSSNVIDEEVDEEHDDLNWTLFLNEEDLISRGFSKALSEKIVKLNILRDLISEKDSAEIQTIFYQLLGVLDIFSLEEESNKIKVIYNLGRFSEIIEDFVGIYDRKNLLMFFNILSAVPENVNLNKKADEVEVVDTDALNLMNIHQAKGLEFPVVIIPSLTSRRFPKLKKSRALLSIPQHFYLYDPYNPLREEENLFYVAMTRTQDQLVLSYFNKYNSGLNTKISSFFECLEDSLVEFDDDFDKINVVSSSGEGLNVKLIDYSAISTFVDCPERFKINYLYGFKAQEIFMQKVGLIYHNAFAKINAKLSKNNHVLDEQVEKILDDSWINLGEEKNNLFRMRIKAGIKRYISFISLDLKRVVGIEQPVSLIRDNIRIRGRSDFLYENQKGEIVLMDYKARRLANILDTHVDLQLKFYADALKRDNQRVDKAVAYPIDEEHLNIDDACISVDDGGEVYEVLENFVTCIKNKRFEGSKKGTLFCKECPYRFMCKHFKGGS